MLILLLQSSNLVTVQRVERHTLSLHISTTPRRVDTQIYGDDALLKFPNSNSYLHKRNYMK